MNCPFVGDEIIDAIAIKLNIQINELSSIFLKDILENILLVEPGIQQTSRCQGH